jgi:hypothetical protein
MVVHIANKRAENNPEHPWLEYSGRNGRMIFQMDLAHSMMGKGLLLDCPIVVNFKKPKLRPRYSRKKDYHPCECGNCFFCKYRITYEVQHKKLKAPRFQVPLPGQPESPHVLPQPPSQHPKKRENLGSGPCEICRRRVQSLEEFKGKTLTELLKLKGENRKLIIHRADVGCRYCVSDTGAVGGKSVQELLENSHPYFINL